MVLAKVRALGKVSEFCLQCVQKHKHENLSRELQNWRNHSQIGALNWCPEHLGQG